MVYQIGLGFSLHAWWFLPSFRCDSYLVVASLTNLIPKLGNVIHVLLNRFLTVCRVAPRSAALPIPPAVLCYIYLFWYEMIF